ncbi:hypothetical protein [Mycoplana rhizolycopersici]|uniref:Uncharacterized protein n=1 Tax=Mycoplana rhizolycopersici TaxID=2746702 RepID=A0ABX2QKB8_9HYPH|nr:hypothetical protein [Rhizobium rhizolycopersici]NVP56776.1 hypothetical protein [Rhizobium rhizolycopersici]
MKRILVIACALGLSAPMAFADCAYHKNTSASADVDKTTTTASISQQSAPPSDEVVLLKKGDASAAQQKVAE